MQMLQDDTQRSDLMLAKEGGQIEGGGQGHNSKGIAVVESELILELILEIFEALPSSSSLHRLTRYAVWALHSNRFIRIQSPEAYSYPHTIPAYPQDGNALSVTLSTQLTHGQMERRDARTRPHVEE